MSSTATRRPKWHYPPPPPTPRILHLPHRPRRKPPKIPSTKPTSADARRDRKGKLETLFHQERAFVRNLPVVLLDYSGDTEKRGDQARRSDFNGGGCAGGGGGGLVVGEEQWRFQAEMLRAECNLLRMEKEIAVKKLGRGRAHMERTLKSALQILVSGRIKMSEGKNGGVVVEEVIQELKEKLAKLKRSSKTKDLEVRSCSNFDKQVSILQRRLEKFRGTSDDICAKDIQEMAEASFSTKTCYKADEEDYVSSAQFNVEVLRRKMEGLSKGVLLKRMEEECNSMLSIGSNSVACSALTSKQIECPNLFSSSLHHQPCQETVSEEQNLCSGRCKAIVRRVMEQVRAEAEQWSQMQEMLGKVREEMEELQESRDFWEDQALNSESQIHSLCCAVQEWRQKAFSSEGKANELQEQLYKLRWDLEMLKNEQHAEVQKARGLTISSPTQNEMEKRVLVCHLKENIHSKDHDSKQNEALMDGGRKMHANTGVFVTPKRSPFQDIGNSSLLTRQNSKAVRPLRCHVRSSTENF